VYYWFRRWRLDGLWQRILVALRRATRQTEGREPSAAIVDSQSVRITEESGGNQGYDAGKNVPGRKRHLLVDTSGLLLAGRVVERSIAWICRNRRLAKDYERKVQTSECLMKVAMIRLMLKRLGRG